MRMRPLLLLAGLGLVGCDNPAASDPEGRLSFSYGGATSGTFEAAGELPVGSDAPASPRTGAVAVRDPAGLTVLALRQGDADRAAAFALLLGAVEEGRSYEINPLACQQAPGGECRVGFFIPDLEAAELGTAPDPERFAARTYVLVLGSVEITSLTRARVRGTFRGTAIRNDGPGPPRMITISGGQFDVPIEESAGGPADRQTVQFSVLSCAADCTRNGVAWSTPAILTTKA